MKTAWPGIITLLVGLTVRAQTPEGCQQLAVETGVFDRAIVRNTAGLSVIRVFVTQGFLDMDAPAGLQPGVAQDVIAQWIPEVQAQTGIALRLEMGGVGGNELCCPPEHSDPACSTWTVPGITLVESLTPTGGNAHAQRLPSGELHCGTIRIPNAEVAPCDFEQFPETGCREAARCDDDARCRALDAVLRLRSMLWHAIMHLLNHAHPTDPIRCPDHVDEESVIGSSTTRLYQGPSAADVRGLRSAFGEQAYPMTHRYTDGFNPSHAWREPTDPIVVEVGAIGPAAAFDANDDAPGWVQPAQHSQVQWAGEAMAILFDDVAAGLGWQTQSVSDALVYHAPVIARSQGTDPNCWLVGLWVADTRKHAGKHLYFRQKIAGETEWHWGGTIELNIAQVDGIGLGFDPHSQRFVVGYVTDTFEVELRTRPLAAPEWSDPVVLRTEAPMWGGVDIACSDASDERGNCLLVGLSADPVDPGIRVFAFAIDPTGIAAFDDQPLSTGPWQTRRAVAPSLAANPQAGDPRFILGYTLGGTAGADNRLYLMGLDRGADGFVEPVDADVLPPNRLGGAPLGTHVVEGETRLSITGPF